MNIGFTKMHGLGNDFVVIDNMNGQIKLSSEQIIFLCDRHKGIGADGVILVESSDKTDCFMNYYNSDGTFAEMCGNGARCTAKFLREELKVVKEVLNIQTRDGVKRIKYNSDDTYSVNMGKPVFSHKDFPAKSLELEGLNLNFVSMGNPHAVAFVSDLNVYDLGSIGPKIENDKNFPNRINFHIVKKGSKNLFTMKTWERGSGITLACGTGACAVYAIARKKEGAEKELTMHLPGGELFMSENAQGDIIMRGPAVSVFSSMVKV